MKKLFVIVFLFAGASEVFCQMNEGDLARLKKLNATFIHNFVTNDTASHARIIHPDFVCISGTGSIIQRDIYLKEWAHGFDEKIYKYWDYREEFIRVFGNMALIRSINKYTILQNGREITGMSLYTDTYVKENGQWRCVQAQITPVTPENYRGDNSIVRKYGSN